ncbi:MAG: MarR family winged helix-turn-helix transcriptional regulator [Sandaracinaceae bacterium]
MPRHRFFYLLNLARHRVFKHADRVAQEELGLSAAQLGALTVIGARPGRSQRELAQTLGYNESAITALMRRMREAELIERTPSVADRRVRTIDLSPKGRELVRASKPLLGRLQARLTDGFTDDELDVVARFLGAARTRFSQDPRSEPLGPEEPRPEEPSSEDP